MKNKKLLGILSIIFIISLFIDKSFTIYITKFQNPTLNNIMLSISDAGQSISVFIVMMLLSLYIILYNKKHNRYVFPMIIALIITNLAVYFLKIGVHRSRPYSVLDIKTITTDTDFSFPSGHSNAVFSIAPFFSLFFSKIGYIWWIFAILVAFSRIYLGMHYLSDVVFSMILGIFIASLMIYLEDKFSLSKKIIPNWF